MLASFIAVLAISIALVMGNYVRIIPSPKVPHDFPTIKLIMNDNVSSEQTIQALKIIETTVLNIDEEIEQQTGQKMIRDILTFSQGRKEGLMVIALVDEEKRPFNTFELARRWREAIPNIPGKKR